MEAIIFIGIQATGKSSFYKERFLNTHGRISIDLLNTRNKELKFLNTCFETHSAFVVDNTNPSAEERKKYIDLAKENRYTLKGYYFSSEIKKAMKRNNARMGKEKIPEAGIRSCYAKLEIPELSEGFDELYFVELTSDGFKVSDWKNEV